MRDLPGVCLLAWARGSKRSGNYFGVPHVTDHCLGSSEYASSNGES